MIVCRLYTDLGDGSEGIDSSELEVCEVFETNNDGLLNADF